MSDYDPYLAPANSADGRYVTADEREALENRYALYRLCECAACGGRGKIAGSEKVETAEEIGVKFGVRCPDCRGEGRTRELVATASDPESVGVALVTLGREGEWDECPVGVLDTMGETGEKWIVRPWLPSTRNVTDAAKLLRSQQGKGTT